MRHWVIHHDAMQANIDRQPVQQGHEIVMRLCSLPNEKAGHMSDFIVIHSFGIEQSNLH